MRAITLVWRPPFRGDPSEKGVMSTDILGVLLGHFVWSRVHASGHVYEPRGLRHSPPAPEQVPPMRRGQGSRVAERQRLPLTPVLAVSRSAASGAGTTGTLQATLLSPSKL